MPADITIYKVVNGVRLNVRPTEVMLRQGAQGPTGPAGAPGPGVPAGGTVGQQLQRDTGPDFTAKWAWETLGFTEPGTGLVSITGWTGDRPVWSLASSVDTRALLPRDGSRPMEGTLKVGSATSGYRQIAFWNSESETYQAFGPTDETGFQCGASLNVTGAVTADNFIGDGSLLTGVEVAGAAASSMAAHVADANPHPQYARLASANVYSALNTYRTAPSSRPASGAGATEGERWGAGAAAGDYGTTLGHGASAGLAATAVGHGAVAGDYGTAVGQGVTVASYGVGVGRSINAPNARVAVGVDLLTSSGTAHVLVGSGATGTGFYQTYLGLGRGALPALNFAGWQGVAVDPSQGYQQRLFGYSSTTPRDLAVTVCTWLSATDATRRAKADHGVFDWVSETTPRVYLSGGTDGTQPQLSFFGGALASKPTVTGSRGGNAALASLLTSLASLGLLTDSTTA